MTEAIQSDYLETKMINHVLRNTAYTKPGTSIWVSLHTANPAEDASGTECSGTDYARVNVSTWDNPSTASHTHNTNAINFPTAGAGGWGHVTHIGIWDDDGSPAGNLLFYGELTDHKDVDAGTTFSIAAGAVTITLGGAISAYLAGAWLSHVLRNTQFNTPGASVYVALYNTGPTEVSTSGTAYERVACAGTSAWDAPGATDGATENTAAITFPTPTASWGELTHFGILDGGMEGSDNLLFGPTALDVATYEPTIGDVVSFAIGALDVTVS
jgi:hypothetical protein